MDSLIYHIIVGACVGYSLGLLFELGRVIYRTIVTTKRTTS